MFSALLSEVVRQWKVVGALVAVTRDDGEVATIEAGPGSGVAGCANLVHTDQKGIAVAVKGNRLHELYVSGGVALAPVLLAGAGVERDPAGCHGAVERLVIHPAEHEDLVGIVLLHDSCNEAGRIPLQGAGDLLRQGARGVA